MKGGGNVSGGGGSGGGISGGGGSGGGGYGGECSGGGGSEKDKGKGNNGKTISIDQNPCAPKCQQKLWRC